MFTSHKSHFNFTKIFVFIIVSIFTILTFAQQEDAVTKAEQIDAEQRDANRIVHSLLNQWSAEAQSAFEQAEKYRTTTNNYRAILRWYKKAAKLDHAEAQFQLWRIYEYALFGKKKNLREAQKWLFEAAKNDHPKAQFMLANAYEKGESSIFEIKVNSLNVRHWYERAAKQGHPEAQNRLKKIIAEAQIMETNRTFKKAKHWLKKAADQGYPMVLSELEQLNKKLSELEQQLTRKCELSFASS